MPTRREVLWIAAAVAAAPAGAALASTFPQQPHTQDDVTLREVGIFAGEQPSALDRINGRRVMLHHRQMLQEFAYAALRLDWTDPQPTEVVATPDLVRSLHRALGEMMESSKQRRMCSEYQAGVAGVGTDWVFSIAFRTKSPEIHMITASHTTRWTETEVAHIAGLARAGIPLPPEYEI